MNLPTENQVPSKVEPSTETNILNLLVTIHRVGVWIFSFLVLAAFMYLISLNAEPAANDQTNLSVANQINGLIIFPFVDPTKMGWLLVFTFGAFAWIDYSIASNLDSRTNHGVLTGYVCVKIILMHLVGWSPIGLAIGLPTLFLIHKPEFKKTFKALL